MKTLTSVLARLEKAGELKKVCITSQPIGPWVIKTECYSSPDWPDTVICSVYTKSGLYIGDKQTAEFLLLKDIEPELKRADSTVCSIGFSKKRNCWAGWSHRAYCEFTINDRLYDPNYGTDKTPFKRHGAVVIKTLNQAKQSAINFADSVS